MRRLWIAIAAGLSLGQTPGVTPVTPPQDPSIRDPAAEALEDAYEQAAEEADGARPPPGYVIQQPLEDGAAPAVLTPTLPDGTAPVTPGQLANEEASQVYQYQAIPLPLEAMEGDDAAMGGSGPVSPGGADVADTAAPETSPGPEYQTTPPGVPSGPTGNVTTGPEGTRPGAIGPDGATMGTQAGAATGQDATGGAGTAGGVGTTGQDATGGVGMTGAPPGTAGPGSLPTPGTGIGGAGATGTAPDTSGTGGTGSTTGTGDATGGTGTTGTGATGIGSTDTSIGGTGATGIGGTDTGIGGTGTTDTGTGGAGTQGTGGAGTGGASAAGPGTAQPSPTQQELVQLRDRVQQLEADLKARDAELAQNTQVVRQQVDTFGERAVEVEQARQVRLAQIQTAGQWMLAADQALEIGELDVGNALSLADRAFANVRSSAAQYGQSTVVVHAERARALINRAQEAAGNRDVYGARVALQDAGFELSRAREASLQRQGTGNVLLTR